MAITSVSTASNSAGASVHRARRSAARRALGLLLMPLLLLLLATPTPSTAQQLSEAQLRQLRNMPAAQRNQLLRSLNVDPSLLQGLQAAGAAQVERASDAREGMASEEAVPPAPGEDFTQDGARAPTLGPDSTVLIEFQRRLPDDAEADEQALEELRPILANLLGKRTYELDRYGVLHLENIFHIRLAGLTPEQAAARIEAEPGLERLDADVLLLPLDRLDGEALPLFGSDFFASAEDLLVDPSEYTVPGDYVLGPGDVLLINLYGNADQSLQVPVDLEGAAVLPELGPVTVAGLSLDQARAEISRRVGEQMIGVEASVTLQRLRSIQVFVLGEVKGPGAYTVDGQTTIVNALLLSGGIKGSGSLRRVTLKRDGDTVVELDLYDLLLRGDTSRDRRLRNGDVVLVDPIGEVVGVEGAVVRPARYELRGGETVGDLVETAGGAKAGAQLASARLERLLPEGVRTVANIDLRQPADLRRPLRGGDLLRVAPALDRVVGTVELRGHVRQPGYFEWREGLRLTDVIRSPDDLMEMADTGYVLIRREDEVGRVSVLSADLRRALVRPRGAADPRLQPRDRIHVFELGRTRDGVVTPLIEQLRDQRSYGERTPVATVSGEVLVPGIYPITPDMRVSDLLRAAGGLSDTAFLGEAELTRQVLVSGRAVETRVIALDLEGILAGDEAADVAVAPSDFLFVRLIPRINDEDRIVLEGEVTFPGIYPIAPGETLSSVLERAGGLTPRAFPDGSRFTRESLRRREEERLEQLANRLERDLAAAAVQRSQEDAAVGAAEALRLAQELLAQIREAPAEGRLVIDLEAVIRGGPQSPRDIVLRDGDRLLVPKVSQEVTVIGEVQFPGSHLHYDRLSIDDYLASAGGLTRQADRKRIYVVRANGEVVTGQDSRWFRRQRIPINAGDTVVVPLDADRLRPLALWSSVTTIIYQLGLAAATASAVGVF